LPPRRPRAEDPLQRQGGDAALPPDERRLVRAAAVHGGQVGRDFLPQAPRTRPLPRRARAVGSDARRRARSREAAPPRPPRRALPPARPAEGVRDADARALLAWTARRLGDVILSREDGEGSQGAKVVAF